MSHGAIFLATCNAILLLRDVNLANTRLRYILLIYSSITYQTFLNCVAKLHEKLHSVTGPLAFLTADLTAIFSLLPVPSLTII